MKYLLTHAHLIIDDNREYLDGALLIEDEIIVDVFNQSNKLPDISDDYQIIDLGNSIVMPGHFDSHTHGAINISFDDCDLKQMDEVSYQFAKDGSTSFLATLSYNLSKENILKQISLFNEYDGLYSRFHGIHLEGPFLNKKHLGIGKPENFLDPDIGFVEKIIETSNKVKQMSIACELDNTKDIIDLLVKNNIRVMCGHSDACLDDLNENVSGFTHLFNAMRGLHHRDITLVNCAFMNKWYCEVIGDGVHIDKNVLNIIMNNIHKDLIILISDSSIARGLEDGEYTFIGNKCIKKGNVIKTIDNHLAGSVVSINDELKVLLSLGAKYTDLLAYSSLNAYRLYGLEKRFGSLEKGKYADIVISDDDLNIKNVYVRGKFIYA